MSKPFDKFKSLRPTIARSPQPISRATCQPIIATASARSALIGVRLPVHDTHTLIVLREMRRRCCRLLAINTMISAHSKSDSIQLYGV